MIVKGAQSLFDGVVLATLHSGTGADSLEKYFPNATIVVKVITNTAEPETIELIQTS